MKEVILPAELASTAYNKDRRFAAEFLGLSPSGLDALHKSGRGPIAKRLGRRWRYSIKSLVEFAESLPTTGGGRTEAA
jgi:hypothetical protein